MKINFSRIFKVSFILFLTIIVSCKNDRNTNPERQKKNRIFQDSLYTKKWLTVDYNDGRIEDVEIYITKDNDTVTNQFKPYRNKQIDTIRSEFYDLKITETEKENIYKGKISIHSKYDKLELDDKNKRTVDFHYAEQNADSMRITSLKSEINNVIEFEFENFYSNRLQGVIIITVLRDTIINKEKMINLFELELLVDNKDITDNMCLEIYEFKKNKPFNKDGLKYKVE